MRRGRAGARHPARPGLRHALIAPVVATALLALARSLLLRVTVDGESMSPYLRHGARALAVRTPFARVRRGALVVGRTPAGSGDRWVRLRDPDTGEVLDLQAAHDAHFVKRVVGVPGDRVRPRHRPLDDGAGGPAVVDVPAGTYFVEGETGFSVDSGLWGPVPSDHILGVVLTRPRARARPRPAARPVTP